MSSLSTKLSLPNKLKLPYKLQKSYHVKPIVRKPTTMTNEVISHGIVYFTISYCGMNWWYYRSLRKKIESQKDENTNDN